MKKLSTCAAVLTTACLATAPAGANNILGIDVSSSQGSIDWTEVKASGVKFAYCATSADSTFTNNMVNGKAAGIQMGAAYFGNPSLETPAQAANYFWNVAAPFVQADGKSISPAITFEVFMGFEGASSYTDWFNQWSADVKAKTSYIMKPVIYVKTYPDACYLSTSIMLGGWLKNHNGENLYTGNPWSGNTSCEVWGPGVWTFWQVTDTGTIGGITGNVDLNAFNGTLAKLISEEGVTATTQ